MDPYAQLDSSHFLSLPRPNILGPPPGVPDTTTLAAHDFDVDMRTGFMPPQPPPARLPDQWQAWESTLEDAITQRLKLGETPNLSAEERRKSESWRNHVQAMPILPITSLTASEVNLRRAHHVLAWILHFYIHSQQSISGLSIHIPPALSVPLLQVCAHLQLPPVLTYSDTILYNWDYISPPSPDEIRPALNNLRSQTTFTGTKDEEEFYLTSARIELKGVEALDVMQDIMDEIFVGDDLAVRRITEYLQTLSGVIRDLRVILLKVKEGCNPDVFYHQIRPWMRGADSFRYLATTKNGPLKREWIFEGINEDPSIRVPEELSGPSAGQSTLIHALDVFLGVDQYSDSEACETVNAVHSSVKATTAPSSSRTLCLSIKTTSPLSSSVSSQGESSTKPQQKPNLMQRMQLYMPRYHRAFLTHLGSQSRPLRAFVEKHGSPATSSSQASDGTPLKNAYNNAVLALKELRDAHLQIVALYIIGPAAAARRKANQADASSDDLHGRDAKNEQVEKDGRRTVLQGTGGTDVIKFLKGVREKTKHAVLG